MPFILLKSNIGMETSYTLNVSGTLLNFNCPVVMGILNVTPDSFYAESRTTGEAEIKKRARQIVDEGGTVIDIGAYSSRPGADDVPAEEEMKRLRSALTAVKAETPDAILSVDTFRADVAKMCVEEFGVDIINDISGGELDRNMFRTIARLGVPYILMHMIGTPATMQKDPHYNNLMRDVFRYFAEKIQHLHEMGVKDIIIDPGFGFGKTLEDNYELMNHLSEFTEFNLPLLVGISRKSMIYKLLGQTAEEALGGTIALNMAALERGADILRVHDVKAAAETVKIFTALQQK